MTNLDAVIRGLQWEPDKLIRRSLRLKVLAAGARGVAPGKE
jgi:hypothetical protein